MTQHIAIHDYGGHPFSLQLSEELAKRHYRVTYIYTSSCNSPNASADKKNDHVTIINIKSVSVKKSNFVFRKIKETLYGYNVVSVLKRLNPDVIISSTTPVDAQKRITYWAKKTNIPSVFWLQDIISLAARNILTNKLGIWGSLIAQRIEASEKQIVRESDHIITISENFSQLLATWGYPASRITLIPNWAPLSDLTVRPKNNSWVREHGLQDQFVFLYAGTLGVKHNPDILLRLAQQFQEIPTIKVVVISEGLGADWLNKQKKEKTLSNLILLDYQPFYVLPDVYGAADVLVALLTEDAGNYSVPSKVLSYLCAGKAILMSVPLENNAAKMIQGCSAGIALAPNQIDEFLKEANDLVENNTLRTTMGRNARQFSEQNFDIKRIGDKIESVLSQALRKQSVVSTRSNCEH